MVANNVEIIVEASLGDTLVKLDLAKHAIKDVGQESEKTAAKTDAAAASSGLFSSALAGMNDALTASVPLLGGAAVPLVALPAVAAAAAVAVVALADAIGTVIAVAAAFVAPLLLITGLLGGLGAAFAYVTAHVLSTNITGQQQHDLLLKLHVAQQTYNADVKKYGDNATQTEHALIALHTAQKNYADAQAAAVVGTKKLSDKFHDLIGTLTKDFTPLITRLVGGLSGFLGYLNQIAKLPLAEAFRSLATKGVQYINQFVYAVANVVKHPIRLAFKIAFGGGKGGNEIASAVAQWWHDFTGYLFGYTRTHQAHIGRWLGPVTKTQVDGIFQPLIDWFNRHDFTKQGTKIGHQILNGLKPLSKPFGQFLVHVFEDAIKTVASNTWNWLEHGWIAFEGRVLRTELKAAADAARALKDKIGPAWDWIKTKASDVWQAIVTWANNAAGAAKRDIETQLGSAWEWVKSKAQAIWDDIVRIFTAPLRIHLSVPSIPSVGGILHGLNPFASNAMNSNVSGGGMVVHMTNHFHGTDQATFSRQVRQIGQELARQQARLADG